MPVTVPDVVRELKTLPPERVEEVYDFVLFLKTRATAPVDESHEWTEQDQQDVVAAALRYAEMNVVDEVDDDDAG